MENEDFFLMMRGYKDKIIDRKRDLRRAVSIIAAEVLNNNRSLFELFPIENDDELKGEIRKKEISNEEHNRNFSKLVAMYKKPNQN